MDSEMRKLLTLSGLTSKGSNAVLANQVLVKSKMVLFSAIMNGPDATKKLREMGCHVAIFGVTTGNVLTEDIAFFKDHGADEVLPKSVRFPSIEKCREDHSKKKQRKSAALSAA